VGKWTWKPGIIPAIKQDIVELFSGSRVDQSRVFVRSTRSQEPGGHCLGTVYQLARQMINGLEVSEEFNDETMMSREDSWALTAAGSAIHLRGVLKAPIKDSANLGKGRWRLELPPI
jgi:hypothetical protein